MNVYFVQLLSRKIAYKIGITDKTEEEYKKWLNDVCPFKVKVCKFLPYIGTSEVFDKKMQMIKPQHGIGDVYNITAANVEKFAKIMMA